MRPEPSDEQVDALHRVSDDTPPADVSEAERAAVVRAGDELVAGRSFDDVSADLTADGWVDADRLVELARVETRHARGVVTRADVVAQLNRQRRHDTRGLAVAFRGGLFGLFGFTTALNAAVRTVRWLRQLRTPPRDE